MHEVKSLSLFVGTAACNAACAHCAGVPLRKYAPKTDGEINEQLLRQTIEDCYARGARRLSLSSSGEPTLSPLAISRVLCLLHDYELQGIKFRPISLYTNGIRIGTDKQFCEDYLPFWKHHGLTTMYVTVHDIDREKNARHYGVNHYPPLEIVVGRIHEAKLTARANIVLQKTNAQKFPLMCTYLLENVGFDKISAWPIRNMQDAIDKKKSPRKRELDEVCAWAQNHKGKIVVLREDNKQSYTNGEKLTLFPDGTLSNTWCN